MGHCPMPDSGWGVAIALRAYSLAGIVCHAAGHFSVCVSQFCFSLVGNPVNATDFGMTVLFVESRPCVTVPR
jgi:hypothetical protein